MSENGSDGRWFGGCLKLVMAGIVFVVLSALAGVALGEWIMLGVK